MSDKPKDEPADEAGKAGGEKDAQTPGPSHANQETGRDAGTFGYGAIPQPEEKDGAPEK